MLALAVLTNTLRFLLLDIDGNGKLGGMSTMAIEIQKKSVFVSVEEAAEIMGCTGGRVRQMLRAGELDGHKINARAWIVHRESAEKNAEKPEGSGRPRVG